MRNYTELLERLDACRVFPDDGPYTPYGAAIHNAVIDDAMTAIRQLMEERKVAFKDGKAAAEIAGALRAMRVAILIGIAMLFSGGIVGLFVEMPLPRYIAMIGAVLWAVAGCAALTLQKKARMSADSTSRWLDV